MDKYANPNPEVVVSLDIGTTKVCAIVGSKNILGQIEILGYGKAVSEGVTRGVVTNIDKTVQAIEDAIDMAEKKAKQELQVVFVGIAGQHIKSMQHQGLLLRDDPNKEITREEIDRLVQDMYRIALPPGDQILHVIPQEFTVDEEEGFKDPVGMHGTRLQSNFHIITGSTSAYNNINRSIERAGIKAAKLTLEPIASAKAVLTKEEMEGGVVLVDIGGGTTDLIIYQEGIIRHTAVIPIGGNVITKDVKVGCTVLEDQAEKLKIRFGSALADEIVDNRIITIPGLKGREPKEISEKNLARIIQARVEEIFDYIMWEIRRSGYENKLIAGMVITGGGAKMKNIELLAEYQTGLSTRIGLPIEHLSSSYEDEIANPMYATGIGLLIEGIQIMLPEKTKIKSHKSNAIFDVEAEEKAQEQAVFQTVETDYYEQEKEESKISRWLNSGMGKVRQFFEPTSDSDL